MEGNQELQFDRGKFLEIFKNKLNEEFLSDFSREFSISYEEFLKQKFKEKKYKTKELATFLGLSEGEVKQHLKFYSIKKTMNFKQWPRELAGSMFIYVLRALLGLIGAIPVFHYMGYLILYGYFFGAADHSLLDVLIKDVPISGSTCYIAGFIFTAIAIFWISAFFLFRRVGKMFFIFSMLYFLFATSLSFMFIFFSANSSFSITVLGKFLLVWLSPALVAAIIWSSTYLAKKSYMYAKEIIMGVIFAALSFFLLMVLNTIWVVLIYIGLAFLLSILFINISRKCSKPKAEINIDSEVSTKKIRGFTLKEFLAYISLVVSLMIVIVFPITSFVVFSTGNYLGFSLSTFDLLKSENIQVKDSEIEGKLVSKDDDNLYISTTSRTLLEISKDASIQITSPKANQVYTGKSENWEVRIIVSFKNDQVWYSGAIKKNNSNITNKISYTLDEQSLTSLEYSDPSEEFYIINELNEASFKDLSSIEVHWGEGSQAQFEKIQLSLLTQSSKINSM